MGRVIVECVPNFSEGRSESVVGQIVKAIASVPSVAVLGSTMDVDHHRSVVTFAGTPKSVQEAALLGVAEAVSLIDLKQHRGVHPRLGAADVVPFVPVKGITLRDCAELAVEVGERIWRRLGVPVFLYEAAARRADRVRLEHVRQGGFETLVKKVLADPASAPDIGGPALHPSAGACIVGARKLLIAYNINLDSSDINIAKTIARSIRASSGGFPHVKALGFALQSRGIVQVSMNLVDFEATPLHVVQEAVRVQAENLGIGILGGEIIGFMPQKVLEQAAAYYLKFESFDSNMVLERQLEQRLGD
jgi:glutamate formiminotransferase